MAMDREERERRAGSFGSVAEVYERMRREFGIHAEPIVLHSPAAELLSGAWAVCRETLGEPLGGVPAHRLDLAGVVATVRQGQQNRQVGPEPEIWAANAP